MEPRIRVNDILEAKDMSDCRVPFVRYNDEELSKKYGISDDEVNAIKRMNPQIVESLKIVVPTKEFYEDMGYIVEDFAKLKAQIMSNNLSNEVMTILLENYEEKLQRFQKRYGNTEKL
nr:MAG TPA: hypothetical protein [Caudoviricetes sp.]